jgi:hypothetical protein
MRRLLTWLAIIFGLVWGVLNVIGNLDEGQLIFANQSATMKAIVAIATSAPWWLPTLIFAVGLAVAICLEFDLLPHPKAELSPFSTKIVRTGDKYRLQVGVKNTSSVKALDTQITTVFWRCSGQRKPFTIRKSNANPISQDIPEQVEVDFTIEPVEPVFAVISFAYRSRARGRLREQRPPFYYRWDGSDSSLVHASKEERDLIIQRLKKRKTVSPAIEFHGDATASATGGAARVARSPREEWQRFSYEEKTELFKIFGDAPSVPVAIAAISPKAGDQFRVGMEFAAWLNAAVQETGTTTSITIFENPEKLPAGVSIYWRKNVANNDMAERIIKAVALKGLACREVPRPMTQGSEVNLMVGEITKPPS